MVGLSKKKKISYVLNLVVVLAVYGILSALIKQGSINSYYSDLLNMVCINVILAVSLNLVTGLLGQLVLGHAGFMLVGAYASALFTLNVKMPLVYSFPISLVIGGLAATLFGFIIGVPALRLKGDYLAIITLGFGEIIRVVANNLTITNGAKGLYGIDSLNTRYNPTGMFTYVFFIAVFAIFLSFTFGTSRHGRAVISIREDEIAAEASGINTTYYKLLAFILAAFIAGIAGGLYAHQIGIIDPAKFDFNRSVEILVMVVLGGMGSITGSVISASVLTVLPEALRGFSDYRMLLYSIVLICVMLFRPTGLLGRSEFSLINMIYKIKEKINKPNKKKPVKKEG